MIKPLALVRLFEADVILTLSRLWSRPKLTSGDSISFIDRNSNLEQLRCCHIKDVNAPSLQNWREKNQSNAYECIWFWENVITVWIFRTADPKIIFIFRNSWIIPIYWALILSFSSESTSPWVCRFEIFTTYNYFTAVWLSVIIYTESHTAVK